MSDRYRPHQPIRFQKPLLWLAFSIFTIAVIWGGLRFASPPITASLIAFKINSDEKVTVKYLIDRSNPNQILNCTLLARDIEKTIVGQVEIEIPATSAKLIELESVVPTRVRAVTAAVVRCTALSR